MMAARPKSPNLGPLEWIGVLTHCHLPRLFGGVEEGFTGQKPHLYVVRPIDAQDDSLALDLQFDGPRGLVVILESAHFNSCSGIPKEKGDQHLC